MSGAIEFNYEINTDLSRRAMTSWARPQRSRSARILRVAVILCGSMVFGLVVVSTGIMAMAPEGFWIGTFVGVYTTLVYWKIRHTLQMKKLFGFGADLLKRQGPIEARFDARNVRFRSGLGETSMDWAGIDRIIEMKDAVALRAGWVNYPIPDFALPVGLSPDAFRAQLQVWHEAAQ